MNKFLNYILTHFKIQTSHPEETHDRGWEIIWTFFKVAFAKRGFTAKLTSIISLKNKDQDINAYVCQDKKNEYWFGWEKNDGYVFVSIDSYDISLLKISGNYVNRLIEDLESDEWCLATRENDDFCLTKQKGKLNEDLKLPERTCDLEIAKS